MNPLPAYGDEPLPAPPWASRRGPFLGLLSILVVSTVGAMVVRPELAPLPLGLAMGLWVLWKVPVRQPTLVFFFLVLALDCFPEQPYERKWQSPLFFLGRLMFDKLNNFGAVIPFPILDLLLFLLLGIQVYRRATRARVDPPAIPLPRALWGLLGLSLLAIAVIELRGLSRGGNFRVSQWQFHQVLLLPMLVALFSSAIRGPEDYRTVGKLILAAGCIKATLGAYFILFVVRPRGLTVEYATTHSDSILYVTGLMILVCAWMEDPSWRRFRWLAAVGAVIFMGMQYNDRRLAYVSLNTAMIAVVLISPWHRVKRSLTRVLIIFLPVIPLYFSVGWRNPTGIFRPLAPIKSVLEGEAAVPGQMDYRDIENFNVITTWMDNPILGSGYGHPFYEVLPMDDISKLFEDWQYHPHNSVLGMLAFGGLLGFTGLWLYLVAVMFLAVRAYHRTHPPEQRAAMLVVVTVVAAYTNQSFGDMGITSWLGTFMMAMAIAFAGKQAIVSGAWPDPRNRPGSGAGVATRASLPG